MSHKRRAVFTMVVCFGNLIFTREAFAQGLVHKLAQPASGRGRDFVCSSDNGYHMGEHRHIPGNDPSGLI
jgi:hypothetical protein